MKRAFVIFSIIFFIISPIMAWYYIPYYYIRPYRPYYGVPCSEIKIEVKEDSFLIYKPILKIDIDSEKIVSKYDSLMPCQVKVTHVDGTLYKYESTNLVMNSNRFNEYLIASLGWNGLKEEEKDKEKPSISLLESSKYEKWAKKEPNNRGERVFETYHPLAYHGYIFIYEEDYSEERIQEIKKQINIEKNRMLSEEVYCEECFKIMYEKDESVDINYVKDEWHYHGEMPYKIRELQNKIKKERLEEEGFVVVALK